MCQWLDFWLNSHTTKKKHLYFIVTTANYLRMKVEFNQLPDNARVWIYAASQPLDQAQQHYITKAADTFTENWTAHQMPLRASFKIINDLFLVFGVDIAHHEVSGCGIDKSVQLIQNLEKELGIDLFNRLQLEYVHQNQLHTSTKSKIAELLANGTITLETPFYNKTVLNVAELKNNFTVPLKNSWVYAQIAKQLA